MVIKIVIGILVLTAVAFTVTYVVLPKTGPNSNQSDTFQPDKNFSTPRQETISAEGENSGNPISGNTSSNSNPAIANPHSSSNTSNPIENITAATTDEIMGKLLTEKQPSVLEGLIKELKKRSNQGAINVLIEKIKQTLGPERARYIMILGRFEDENTLPLLAGLSHDADKGTKFTALSAIAGFGTEKSTMILLGLLDKAVEDFEKGMIEQMLFKAEPDKTIPSFIGALSNENIGVALKANEFLEKFSKATYTITPEDKTSVANAKDHWQAWWEEYKSKNN